MTVKYEISQETMTGMVDTANKYTLALSALEDIDRVSHDKKAVHKILKAFFKAVNRKPLFDESEKCASNYSADEYLSARIEKG